MKKFKIPALIFVLSISVLLAAGCESGEKSGKNSGTEDAVNTTADLPKNSLEFEESDDGSSYSVSGIGTYESDLVEIPSEYNGKPVTAIGSEAFSGCTRITGVIIPDSVTTVDYASFDGCTSLEQIEIPDSVTVMGIGVFADCTGLKSIQLSENVTYIDTRAFENCSSLTAIHIPAACTSISVGAFDGCSSLAELTVQEENQRLMSVDNCIIDMEEKMLELGCPTSIIPDDYNLVNGIGAYSFAGSTNLKSIEIPENITTIGRCAFKETGLSDVVIPSRMKAIGDYAFENCKDLKSLTIGERVTYIAPEAFAGCTNLETLVFKNTETWYLSPDGSEGEVIDVTDSEATIGYLTASDVEHYLYRK